VGFGLGASKSGDAKMCFSAGGEGYVHYFKDIRQGALQSDCVTLLILDNEKE